MIGSVILAHLVGDYLIQSHWMATEKVKHWWPAIVHGITYTIPFVLVTQSWPALLVIMLTHIVIDRYRLAKYVVWFKNQAGPRASRPVKADLKLGTGYPEGTPAWLAVWLLIIADNVIHILINVAAVELL